MAAQRRGSVKVLVQPENGSLGGERPVRRPTRVRQPQREQLRLRLHPAQHNPEVGEVDLSLRTRGVGLRHEPLAELPAGLDRDLRAAAGDVVPHRRVRHLAAPCSSTSRASTRRAVWRCLRGASRSSRSISSTTGLNSSSRRDTRTGVLRSGGSADASAWRTVRRCTLCRSASCRIDNPSIRSSRRIAANRSTLDPISALPFVVTDLVGDHARVGPDQTVTGSPACRGGATSNRHCGRGGGAGSNRPTGANSDCHGQVVE